MPSELFYLNSLDRFISYIGGIWLVFIFPWSIWVSEINANSVAPDQTPQNAASDQGLHCLPMSLLRDTKLIWVNRQQITDI